jgi:hypothetical protein
MNTKMAPAVKQIKKNSLHIFSKPITLKELQIMFLSDNHIKVEEINLWNQRKKAIRQALDDQLKRRVTITIIAILLILVLIPIILPDRYEMVLNLINILLATVSGFALGNMNIIKK